MGVRAKNKRITRITLNSSSSNFFFHIDYDFLAEEAMTEGQSEQWFGSAQDWEQNFTYFYSPEIFKLKKH